MSTDTEKARNGLFPLQVFAGDETAMVVAWNWDSDICRNADIRVSDGVHMIGSMEDGASGEIQMPN